MRDSFLKIAPDRREAIRGQVRTSTGFTWRRAGAVAVGPRLGERWRGAAVVAPEVERAPVVRREIAEPAERQGTGVERMMRALASWPEDRPLARTAELAEIAGLVRADMTPSIVSSRVTTVLGELQRRGLIEVHAQAYGPARRERAVLVRAPGGEGGGRVLATEGAPEAWAAGLRARAALATGLVGGK